MLENLTDKLGSALRNLRGVGKLTEENMEEALKEVRKALLSADVHFKVAREFVSNVKEQCVGQEVLKSVTPGQQVIKIIHDELVKLLGEGTTELEDKKPLRIMMVGLHGSGKTTSSGKLANYLAKKRDYRPALIACDVYRPAAIDQLETLSQTVGCEFYGDREEKNVVTIGKRGLEAAKAADANLIIFDTAGRLQIDEDLIEEIKDLKAAVQPDEVLLVADAALGQEAVNVAKHFHEAVDVTGIILTKLDGDARGGAALSMKTITDTPIKFMGIGEKVDEFDVFHPDRMASRILGMGDVVSLVEKAQETIDQDEAERMAEKMRKAEFDLNDFLKQMQQVKKMGSLGSIVSMLPGASGIEIGDEEEKKMARTEAIILSMTPKERSQPRLLKGSRLKRVAQGSGVQVREVNALLKQFGQMQKMMKMMRGGKGRKMMKAMKAHMQENGESLPNMPNL
ncbi:signal recognition particle protein [Coraliomargarita akajimensis]|uniref:Signal recognition particle protein n=1 Tax=Coraliomargarita akajimensis (strain DSM 45221 / IAM 15411 / JCM 23193 / KCTC 12865 / 04OKA010-24) TaxID=583355 RepID=D5EJN2_CORAD|nr:signal recognition particle protein [Coraliomargarita akajimensis]ADE54631.1 signal recognition particle protein [Coraliomargarita akajimensis DSM 45221]